MASVPIMQGISAYYANKVSVEANPLKNLLRDVHLTDVEFARELAANPKSGITRHILEMVAFDGSSVVPFIDGPYLLSHAAVSSAISQTNQGRAKSAFFSGTEVVSDAWGVNGPTQESTNTGAHTNARQAAMAAWPVLSGSDYITIDPLPKSIKEAAANSNGDLSKIDNDTYEQLTRYVAGAVLGQLYPGCVIDDGLLAAFASIAVFQVQVVAPKKYHSLAGQFSADTLRISRKVFMNWVESYYGEEKMTEICAHRASEGLTNSEVSTKRKVNNFLLFSISKTLNPSPWPQCAMALADSTWVNTLKPLLGLTVAALERLYKDLGAEVEAFQSDPDKWLIEVGRYER
jgi:hypothetical protein